MTPETIISGGILGIIGFFIFLILIHTLKKDEKAVSNEEIFEKLERMDTGYLKSEVLRNKIQYFVKQVRWRSQNETEIIILKNNIDKNIEKTDKKIDNIYFENEVEMNAMLYDLCSESTLNHVMDIFKEYNQENKSDVAAIITRLKIEHEKIDEERAIEELKVVMNKFEKRVTQAIKDSL